MRLDHSARAMHVRTERNPPLEVVFRVARFVEPNEALLANWYFNDPIAGLGGRTASDLAQAGETRRLVALLRNIAAHSRYEAYKSGSV